MCQCWEYIPVSIFVIGRTLVRVHVQAGIITGDLSVRLITNLLFTIDSMS